MERKNINGYEVCFLPDERFKTAAFMIYLRVPLDTKTASYYSLLPSVLLRGNAQYPETKDLNIYLETLYGASCSFQISKRGAEQVILLHFKTVADAFAEGETPFLKLVELASNLLFCPLIEQGAFRASYTEREKENLKQYINGILNDKRKYAKERLIAEMCKNEEYSISAHGTIEAVDSIQPNDLYDAYKTLLQTADISFYAAERFDEDALQAVLEKVLPKRAAKNKAPLFPAMRNAPAEPRLVTETAPVTQGKLSMGFRTSVTRTDPQFYAMLLCNALFGGAPYSKLFTHVRERLSLAYYASSQYLSTKGLLLVNSGIEFSNFEAAKNEILAQLQEMQKGNFTESDISFAKLDVTDALRGISDTGEGLADFYANLHAVGVTDTVDSVIQKLSVVNKNDIINAANTIQADTIYFLKGGAA